jgi:hypothetical protein
MKTFGLISTLLCLPLLQGCLTASRPSPALVLQASGNRQEAVPAELLERSPIPIGRS